MKFILFIVVVVLALLSGCYQHSVDQLQAEIDIISKHWVPDKRVGICNLRLVKSAGGEMTLKGESLFPGAKAEALKLLSSKGISVIDSAILLPDTINVKKSWGLINISVANLRGKSAHASELVSQAIMGTPVRILKEDNGWVLVQTPENYIAWTNESSVQKMSFTEMIKWRNSDRMIYTESFGKVYKDPKLIEVISDLVAGAIVAKLSESQDFSSILLPDGRAGYVANINWFSFNQWKDTVSVINDQLIKSGRQFLGFPYLWGGTSSKAMDCSGFVKTVFFLNGIILERDASQQVKHGAEVDVTSGWNNLQKGDLLFFGSRDPYRVTHVAIYIGNSELIHSSGSVRINSLDNKKDNYSNILGATLLAARRVIGLPPENGYLPVRLNNWY
ncbi:MAG: C40 family peptidase [Mariniphaga sp.]